MAVVRIAPVVTAVATGCCLAVVDSLVRMEVLRPIERAVDDDEVAGSRLALDCWLVKELVLREATLSGCVVGMNASLVDTRRPLVATVKDDILMVALVSVLLFAWCPYERGYQLALLYCDALTTICLCVAIFVRRYLGHTVRF